MSVDLLIRSLLTLGASHRLLALDEIHRFPGWKRYLKGLWDTRKDRVDVIVTGSGRLDVYQKGTDCIRSP